MWMAVFKSVNNKTSVFPLLLTIVVKVVYLTGYFLVFCGSSFLLFAYTLKEYVERGAPQ